MLPWAQVGSVPAQVWSSPMAVRARECLCILHTQSQALKTDTGHAVSLHCVSEWEQGSAVPMQWLSEPLFALCPFLRLAVTQLQGAEARGLSHTCQR